MRKLLSVLLCLGLAGAARAQGPEGTKSAEPVPAAALPPPSSNNGLKPDEEIVPNPPKKWGFAFLGAAGGCFLIAIATGAAALGKSSEQEGSVSSPPLYTQDLKDSGKSGSALATTSYAFVGIGAALAIVDAVIWFEVLRKPKVVKKSTTAKIELTPMGVRF